MTKNHPHFGSVKCPGAFGKFAQKFTKGLVNFTTNEFRLKY